MTHCEKIYNANYTSKKMMTSPPRASQAGDRKRKHHCMKWLENICTCTGSSYKPNNRHVTKKQCTNRKFGFLKAIGGTSR